MKKILFLFFLPFSLTHAVFIKQNTLDGLSVSADTTTLDDLQSSKFLGLFYVEDILNIPEYEYKFYYDFRDLINRGEYLERVIVYKMNQKYKMNLKLLKLKLLKKYKGQFPESDYIYSISQNVTEGLQPGDLAVMSFYKFSDLNHGVVLGYDINNLKEHIGNSFFYYHINKFIPVLPVIEDENHQLFIPDVWMALHINH